MVKIKKQIKLLSPIPWDKEESSKANEKANQYGCEHPEALIDWLRDAEQIPEEGESVDAFLERTGWTLEEENRQRKIGGLPLLKNVDEYKQCLRDGGVEK